MSTDDELFTPSQILGGFSAKRARLLLFQIENRTAYLMMQAQRAVDRYLGVTYVMMRQGVFARRVVIEVRQDLAEESSGTYTVTDSGRAATHARVRKSQPLPVLV